MSVIITDKLISNILKMINHADDNLYNVDNFSISLYKCQLIMTSIFRP